MDYKNVIKDYASGTIDPKLWVVVMDNDGGYWGYRGPEISEEAEEELSNSMYDKYGSPDGYRDVVDILSAAGVSTEWC